MKVMGNSFITNRLTDEVYAIGLCHYGSNSADTRIPVEN